MRYRFFALLAALVAAASSVQAASVQPPPPPVEDYGKLPAMEFVRLSPSGTRYAFVGERAGQRFVVVATTATKPLQSLNVSRVKIVDLEWAGDDHLLITTSSTVTLGVASSRFKDEMLAVNVLNVATGKLVGVFSGASNTAVANAVVGEFGTAEIGGRWYGYFGGYSYDDNHDIPKRLYPKTGPDGQLYPDLYRVNLDTGWFELVAAGNVNLSGWLIGPDGAVAARQFYSQSHRSPATVMAASCSPPAVTLSAAPISWVSAKPPTR